ncbi:MAG TPA: hypothetical protein VIJ94_13235 [Caulobacteraceae bacterium]
MSGIRPMRLIAFFASIAVLFALTDVAAAQTALAASAASTAFTQPQTPSARAAGLRMLSWPGKVGERTPAPVRVQAIAEPQRRIWNPAPISAPPAPSAAPVRQAALPTSIYAPPPPAAAPVLVRPAPVQQARAAQMTAAASPSDGDYQPPHFYSLYREYGQKPDPIPLNSQFFAAATPDLAQPPPDLPHNVTTSTGRVIQAPSPSPDDGPG